MRHSNPFRQNVNMAISVIFILSFGLVATSTILRASRFDDLFTGTTGIALDADR